MNAQEGKRLSLFNRFARNLSVVKKHPALLFDSDFDLGYLCPLCLQVRFQSDLAQTNSPSNLTLEDLPPASLGGTPRLLTCRGCNSTSGHTLDSVLSRFLNREDLSSFRPGSKGPVDIVASGARMAASLKVAESGALRIDLRSEHSDPAHRDVLIDAFQNPGVTLRAPDPLQGRITNTVTHEVPFSLRFRPAPDPRIVELALLRIGYLIGFATFGHGWLLNPRLTPIREQLNQPDKQLLSGALSVPGDFPDEHLGVNIISGPKELQCFLIVFDLNTEASTRRFAIALPGPSGLGIDVYDNLERAFQTKDTEATTYQLHFVGEADFVGDDDLAFASLALWQKYTQ